MLQYKVCSFILWIITKHENRKGSRASIKLQKKKEQVCTGKRTCLILCMKRKEQSETFLKRHLQTLLPFWCCSILLIPHFGISYLQVSVILFYMNK